MPSIEFTELLITQKETAMLFRNRAEAGRMLAEKLLQYRDAEDVLVLALPRGGVPIAFEVARSIHAPLDVLVVRKLGAPGEEELAIGAIAPAGVRIINHLVVQALGISMEQLDAITEKEQRELERRERLYRDNRPSLEVQGRRVILIDDGLATGSSMRAAVFSLRQQNAAKVIVAVPVAASSTCDEFRSEVDEMICAATPQPFLAVGQWYQDFSQTTDEEVRALLRQAAEQHSVRAA